MTEPFFTRLKMIDDLISNGADKVDFKVDVKPLLLEHASEMYFYKNISESSWLDILLKEGIYSRYPEPIIDDSGNVTSYSSFPPIIYLLKAVEEQPEKVINIILKMPDTDNPWIQDNIIDIALSDLSTQSIKLIPRIEKWDKTSKYSLISQKLSELVIHLAKEITVNEAFDLAKNLLEISTSAITTSRVMDGWNYDQALKKCLQLAHQ